MPNFSLEGDPNDKGIGMTTHIVKCQHINLFYVLKQVLDIAESWKEATRMAENSVSIALNEKKRKLTEIIESDSNRLNTKRGK